MEEASEEDRAAAAARAAAAEEKAKGNAAYKAKRFEEALGHYDAALQLDDRDISFLTNKWVARGRGGNGAVDLDLAGGTRQGNLNALRPAARLRKQLAPLLRPCQARCVRP
jgi:tetratricopeptide (TPR) repeat protein